MNAKFQKFLFGILFFLIDLIVSNFGFRISCFKHLFLQQRTVLFHSLLIVAARSFHIDDVNAFPLQVSDRLHERKIISGGSHRIGSGIMSHRFGGQNEIVQENRRVRMRRQLGHHVDDRNHEHRLRHRVVDRRAGLQQLMDIVEIHTQAAGFLSGADELRAQGSTPAQMNAVLNESADQLVGLLGAVDFL